MRRTHQRTLVALAAVVATMLAGKGMGGAPTQEPTAQHPGRADYIEVGCYPVVSMSPDLCHGPGVR